MAPVPNLRKAARMCTEMPASAHIDTMARKRSSPELVCIVCSGGACDINGAHTVCALCELQGLTAPEAVELPAAA